MVSYLRMYIRLPVRLSVEGSFYAFHLFVEHGDLELLQTVGQVLCQCTLVKGEVSGHDDEQLQCLSRNPVVNSYAQAVGY